jgi:hypothetical protein
MMHASLISSHYHRAEIYAIYDRIICYCTTRLFLMSTADGQESNLIIFWPEREQNQHTQAQNDNCTRQLLQHSTIVRTSTTGNGRRDWYIWISNGFGSLVNLYKAVTGRVTMEFGLTLHLTHSRTPLFDETNYHSIATSTLDCYRKAQWTDLHERKLKYVRLLFHSASHT